MKIFVDIDETICFYDDAHEVCSKDIPKLYHLAKPDFNNIAKINKLYDKGNEITYWTARGTKTKIDHYDLTKTQLDEWGCKYHNLRVGDKPAYHLLICDRTKRIEEI